MNSEYEMHQLMQDRQQMLAEALQRAEAGVAKQEDWDIIRYECGLPKRPIVTLETLSIRSE